MGPLPIPVSIADASPASPASPTSRPSRSVVLLDRIELRFDRAFGQAGNPWRHLGGLAYFLFWITAATGIYVYIGFDTRGDGAYASVERLSSNAFPLGSLARSLHRYASDALILVTLVHLVREWVHGRYAHFRRFSWLTGVLALGLLLASGIGGFWLVWDELAQYSLVATTEWLDTLPVFDGTLIRNFIAPEAVSDRLFSLLIFLHIGFPLALLAVMWVHVQRLSQPASRPPRALGFGTAAALLLLCVVRPVTSGAPAGLDQAPGVLQIDWFYLGIHPFADGFSPLALWAAAGVFTLLLLGLPYAGRAARVARAPAAVVDLDHCNGCARCFADCPYAAVTMQPRTDGRAHARQAVVDADLCASCGICAGACPSSTPFASSARLVTGIDMPHAPLHALRTTLEAALARIADGAAAADDEPRIGDDASAADDEPRIVVFGCDPANGGADLDALAGPRTATVPLVCASQLPPSFIEYALRAGADGVLVAGCRSGDCGFRLGDRWFDERLAGARAPHLRASAPRERVRVAWVGRGDVRGLVAALQALRGDLRAGSSRHAAPTRPPKRLDRASHRSIAR